MRRFGLELEFLPFLVKGWYSSISKRTLAASKITGHGFLDVMYNRDSSYYKIKDNGGLVNYWVLKEEISAMCEVNTPALEDYQIASLSLKKLLNGLDSKKWVDRECGLHVHVDVRDLWKDPKGGLKLAAVLYRFYQVQSVFFKMHPYYPERLHFCSPFGDRIGTYLKNRFKRGCSHESVLSIHSRMGLALASKSLALSAYHFYNYGTLEFRLAPATVDHMTASSWGAFCTKFVQDSIDRYKEVVSSEVETPMTFIESLGLPEPVLDWAMDRYRSYRRNRI